MKLCVCSQIKDCPKLWIINEALVIFDEEYSDRKSSEVKKDVSEMPRKQTWKPSRGCWILTLKQQKVQHLNLKSLTSVHPSSEQLSSLTSSSNDPAYTLHLVTVITNTASFLKPSHQAFHVSVHKLFAILF
jgi:hypothetical protein